MRSRGKLTLAMASIAVVWGVGLTYSQDRPEPKKLQQVTPAQRKEAAKRARATGLKPGVAGIPKARRPGPASTQAGGRVTNLSAARGANAAPPLRGTEGPGGIPHYFGPYGNWAYSPLPKGPVVDIAIVDGGTGYNSPLVAIDDAYGTGESITISSATPEVVFDLDPATGAILAVALPVAGVGANFSAPIATIIDDPAQCGGSGQPACGQGALADATIGGALTGGMQKFVDSLPLLGPAGANNLGQYIPLAIPDTGTYSGEDFYEIGLVEYTEIMHTSLPPTRLRGYVQLVPAGWTGTDALGNAYSAVPLTVANGLTHDVTVGGAPAYGASRPHYLGPTIIARGRVHGLGAAGAARPTRIKFHNLLPTGPDGNLFIPVDETVPGSGPGPTAGTTYTQNRAAVHLHGNNTIWISDGNVHQWITPANEVTPYRKGVSVRNVPGPDTSCDAANSGCMTFYYTNAQSARLQFYHDHALGITRLNVYAGEAAGYLLTDMVETDMILGTNVTGVNPGGLKVLPDLGIPLVIQDKTWVDADTVFAQDPTWNWGTGPRAAGKITAANTGDLWYPHVYMSAQNPWDLAGVNAFGRWHYGPWFNPPVPECLAGGPVGCIEQGPVPNEYFNAVDAPWEPPMRPGVPNPSIPGEGFLDTPLVNGTAYPYLEVEPRAYRFRILNAANDRMLNLQLYEAADKTSWIPASGAPGVSYVPGTPTALCGSAPVADCTEVKMVPVSVAPANQYADWPSGIPDATTAGPEWWMIGTEGGFMPRPVVVPQQPVGWNLNPTTFNFGTVNQHSLLIGSAERADVVVDFSQYAGKTLILYNDAPAAFPAGVPTYDYYTGVPNQMDAGGAPTTLPGYGPNTRTIMQIRVKASGTPTPDVTLANLEAVFAKTANKRGVFEVSQDPILIPQAEYNSAYNASFPTSAAEQFIQIADTAKTFRPIDENGVPQAPVTLPLEMKAMHDEMGGVYDTMFGRMSGMLGLTNPLSPVHVLIPYGLAAPPTDLVMGSLEGKPVGVMPDGTQIWRIFHNGVDSHTIHTHLFHAQLVNRLGQDGLLLPIDPIELGWKDTFRVNPLEITYLAMRPTIPTQDQIPFEVPDSTRLIDPTLPAGADLIPPPPAGWFTPTGTAIARIRNHVVNFGWEYVWHCHILAHEEMDMMHSLVFAVPPMAPTNLSATLSGPLANPRVNLTWTDNSQKELRFRVERASDEAFTIGVRTWNVAANAVAFTDTTPPRNAAYHYRVWAIGRPIGDAQTAGFPTMAADSVSKTVFIQVGTPIPPATPSNLQAFWQAGPQVSLTWTDNAVNENSFVIERCTGLNCTAFAQLATRAALGGTGAVSYVDTTVANGSQYSYRVKAINVSGSSPYSNVVNAFNPALPPAPTGVVASPQTGAVLLTWGHAGGAASFTIQRATNAAFTTGVGSTTVAPTPQSFSLPLGIGTYYIRIRANNGAGGSSAWTNASPFPVRVTQ
jgi:FtsP/CotA-like multicopper oxidase with cupredoxin domain